MPGCAGSADFEPEAPRFRQIEMLNLFMGFEVANRYAISELHRCIIPSPSLRAGLDDVQGNVLGYLAEEPRGFLGTFARQLFRTHRAFRSVVMDANGTPVLWVRSGIGLFRGTDISTLDPPTLLVD